jgi:hypothetical protein
MSDPRIGSIQFGPSKNTVSIGDARSERRKEVPTCGVSGPQNTKCFLVKGHKGRHRDVIIIEWSDPKEAA